MSDSPAPPCLRPSSPSSLSLAVSAAVRVAAAHTDCSQRCESPLLAKALAGAAATSNHLLACNAAAAEEHGCVFVPTVSDGNTEAAPGGGRGAVGWGDSCGSVALPMATAVSMAAWPSPHLAQPNWPSERIKVELQELYHTLRKDSAPNEMIDLFMMFVKKTERLFKSFIVFAVR